MIRTAWVLLAGAVLTFTLSATLVLANLFRHRDMPELCERLGRFWARGVVRMAGARIELSAPGREDWPERSVIVANHQSWFDVFSLAAALPVTYRFVAKEELARIPVFGGAWQACGHVSLARDDRTRAIRSLDQAAQQVRARKTAIVLFPEGTRSPDGRMRAFKKGAFVLAINNGVPVIPVGISGTRAVMPKGSFRIRPGEIRIRVGDPIPTEGMVHRDRHALLLRARAVVASLTDEPDALAQAPEGDEDRGEDHGNRRGAEEGTG